MTKAAENGGARDTSSFVRVASLCDDFRAAGESGAAPSIDSYLERVAEEARPTLLRNLLAVELGRRRAAGERPRLEEFLERFPRFVAVVRSAFLQDGTVVDFSIGDQSTCRGGASRPAAKAPSVSQMGEYRLLAELGRGGMGIVYEAVHLARGERVALKTLPAVDGARLYQFKREFRALADVNHPNLIGLHTLESDGCHWFFTMDLIDGVDFLSHVRPSGTLDLSRLRQALSQLVTGVLALHGKHIIHRDLKPSNVMVTDEGRVIVLDFGLALEEEGSWSADKVAGTPKYMAPEQAAGGKITAASDWYAVGVMLYEALTGKAPFVGRALQVLQAKQLQEAPDLPADAAIPSDLACLTRGLLRRDPRERPDAREIVRVAAFRGDAPTTTRPTSGLRLVGREQQLAALTDSYRWLRKQQQPLSVFIRGRSGEGKTSLAEHFLEPLRARREEVAVMSGRCYDRESVPFKALDSLIDALCSYLRSLPETDAALLIPDDMGVLVQVFPVLQRVGVAARAAAGRPGGLDEHQVRQRAFRALRALLTRMSRRTPVVWFIDDLQWGDADSAEALFEVLRPPEAPTALFLGTFRSEEADASPFLRAWGELLRKHDVQVERRDVSVGPLTVEECTRLVVALLGQDGEAIRRRAAEFAQETGGNPFLLIELVGCFDPATDSFHVLPINEVIDKKLGRLPADAPGLLEVVAVSGQALPVGEASRATGHAAAAVATLTHMRNERLVRLVGTDENPLVDTYHDRIRETVLRRLEEGRRKTLHRTLAEVIEEEAGGVPEAVVAALERGEYHEEKAVPRVYDLAYHFDAAGEKRKALACGVLAAEQARRQSALEVAAQQYAIARRNLPEANHAVGCRIALGSATTLMLLGRYEEAAEQLEGVSDLVADAEGKAQVEAIQAEIASKQGLLDKSIAYYEQGLRRLGNWVPRTALGWGFGILKEALVQCAHSLLPWRLHRLPPSSRLELSVRLFNRASQPYCFENSFKMLWSHLAGLNGAELLPPSPQLTHSIAIHGMWRAMMGWQAGGARYGERAIAMARESGDLLAQGSSCNHQGIGLYAAARYEEGLVYLTRAITAFDQAGDPWESHLAHFHKGCCHFGLGDLVGAVAEARWTFTSSARVGDPRVLCSSYLWARATRGNIPFEELKSCYPSRPDDIMSTVHGVLAEGLWHTFHGRTGEALRAFEQAAGLVRKSFCVNSHMILVAPMLAMGLRLHADAARADDARQLRRRALRVAKWGTRLTRLFPAAYPFALRERALALAALGKTREALKFADGSCAAAEAQKAKYEHAQSLLVRGRLARELGLAEAGEQLRAAESALDAIERPVREEAAGPAGTAPRDPASQPPVTPGQADAPAVPAARRRRLVGLALVILAAIGAVLAGGLLGWCTGYVLGFMAGAVAGDVAAWKAAGAGPGAAVGWVALPAALLLGWILVRRGLRHHEAEVRRRPGERPTPPPAVIRYGLPGLAGVLVFALSTIPAALGVWLGNAAGGGSGPLATGLSALGGVLGLALPVVLWRLAR
jgi:serine/threonine protein kinase/tetratricopeptide (TPR) repeat protein